MPNVSYLYLKEEPESHLQHEVPVACIAFYTNFIPGLINEPGEVYFGWSVCSKQDSFSYKAARGIANQRLDKAIKIYSKEMIVDFPYGGVASNVSEKEYLPLIFDLLIGCPRVPVRMKNSIKLTGATIIAKHLRFLERSKAKLLAEQAVAIATSK